MLRFDPKDSTGYKAWAERAADTGKRAEPPFAGKHCPTTKPRRWREQKCGAICCRSHGQHHPNEAAGGVVQSPFVARRGCLPKMLCLILILPDLERQIGKGPGPAFGDVYALT